MSFSLFGFGFGGYGYMPSYLGGPAFSGFSPYYGGIAPTLGLGGLGFNGCLYGGLGLLTWGGATCVDVSIACFSYRSLCFLSATLFTLCAATCGICAINIVG